MKRILAMLLVLAAVSMMLGVTAFAADKTVQYYDEKGNAITVSGLYYDNQGCLMYNADCYYLDADGNPVYVGGCRAYYRDADGNLVAPPAETRPPVNRGNSGWGGCCGGWR